MNDHNQQKLNDDFREVADLKPQLPKHKGPNEKKYISQLIEVNNNALRIKTTTESGQNTQTLNLTEATLRAEDHAIILCKNNKKIMKIANESNSKERMDLYINLCCIFQNAHQGLPIDTEPTDEALATYQKQYRDQQNDFDIDIAHIPAQPNDPWAKHGSSAICAVAFANLVLNGDTSYFAMIAMALAAIMKVASSQSDMEQDEISIGIKSVGEKEEKRLSLITRENDRVIKSILIDPERAQTKLQTFPAHKLFVTDTIVEHLIGPQLTLTELRELKHKIDEGIRASKTPFPAYD